jgi:hypothetical protein
LYIEAKNGKKRSTYFFAFISYLGVVLQEKTDAMISVVVFIKGGARRELL